MQTRANRRRCGAIAAALLVVVALQHCMTEPIPELAGGTGTYWSAQTADSAPISGCENESGCICRGATVVGRVSAPEAQDWVLANLEDSAGSRHEQDPRESAALLSGGFSAPPPISGRQLRARIASFLI